MPAERVREVRGTHAHGGRDIQQLEPIAEPVMQIITGLKQPLRSGRLSVARCERPRTRGKHGQHQPVDGETREIIGEIHLEQHAPGVARDAGVPRVPHFLEQVDEGREQVGAPVIRLYDEHMGSIPSDRIGMPLGNGLRPY